MKRIVSLIITAFILTACIFTFSACKKKCEHIAGNEQFYAESGGVVTISKKCKMCGEATDEVIDTFNADAVIKYTGNRTADGNEVTKAQQTANGDITICLKKGTYGQIYVGDFEKKVRLVAEEGTRVEVVQVNGGADGVTIENIDIYYNDPETDYSPCIKFETAGGFSYWSNITIKNCNFSGLGTINSAWKKGVVENLTVDGCTFKDVTNNVNYEDSNLSAIFIGETWGTTVIKNCHFEHIAYSAIRLGYYSVEGETIIENCYFKDIVRNRCIMFTAKNETLQDCQVSLVVRGCIFDDTGALRFTKSTTVTNSNLYVYANTWRQIPTSIDNATYYDAREQSEL